MYYWVGGGPVGGLGQQVERQWAEPGATAPPAGQCKRGWNLSLGRCGEESSQQGGHCPGGGLVGRLFSASNNTAPGSHCYWVKGPNGGVTGVRGQFSTLVSGRKDSVGEVVEGWGASGGRGLLYSCFPLLCWQLIQNKVPVVVSSCRRFIKCEHDRVKYHCIKR